MAELLEKQYELGGVVFGEGTLVRVKDDGWKPGGADIDRADSKRASGDGVRFGRDKMRSATWGFDLFTNADDDDGDAEAAAWDALSALHAAWSNEWVRQNAVVRALRYRVAGQTRIIYGKPRRWTSSPNNLSLSGRIDATADFETIDHLVYEDSLNQHSVGLVPPEDPQAGFTAPFIAPLSIRPRSAPRQSEILVGGSVATPIIVEFTGPISSPAVEVTSLADPDDPERRTDTRWTAALKGSVIEGDPVTFDPRPWNVSVTKKSGGGVSVNPRITRISKMWLPPGRHAVVFTGDDPSGLARATLRWRNAHVSPR